MFTGNFDAIMFQAILPEILIFLVGLVVLVLELVLPEEKHGVFNTGKELLTMICVVPLVDGKMPGMPAQD